MEGSQSSEQTQPISIKTPESENPEILLSRIITQTDAVFERLGQPREPGKRFGVCGFASDLVRRSAERLGGSDIHCENRQLLFIHQALGATDYRQAFQHGVNILKIGNVPYLVDISFSQFIDPESGDIRQGINLSSGNSKDHLLAKQLMEKGFVQLTDKSLRDYLKMTTSASDIGYIDLANVARLLSDATSITDYDHNIKDLDRYLEGT